MASEIKLNRIDSLPASQLLCAIKSLSLSMFVHGPRKLDRYGKCGSTGVQSSNSGGSGLRKAVFEKELAQKRSRTNLPSAATIWPEAGRKLEWEQTEETGSGLRAQ
jgi:hypothetical protein